jgi:hypothetical protein
METILFFTCVSLLLGLYLKKALIFTLQALAVLITVPVYFPVAMYRNYKEWYRAGGNKRALIIVTAIISILTLAVWLPVIFL